MFTLEGGNGDDGSQFIVRGVRLKGRLLWGHAELLGKPFPLEVIQYEVNKCSNF